WLAGVLMFVMLRNFDGGRRTEDGKASASVVGPPSSVSRLAALLGALVFMFNDFNITHIGNPNMVAVGAWLPLALLLFQRALTSRRMFFAMLAGAVTGMAYLAGHIQPFLYILFAVGLYAVYFILTIDDRPQTAEHRPSSIVRAALSVVAFLLFTILIAGISLVPNVEMSSQSLRESLSYEDAARFSLPPAEMIGLFVPALFGRGPDIHWGAWERVEVGYVGILPLILAALALLWRRERLPRFFALLALVAFILAMGLYSIVHGWLSLVPGYSQIRVPARFVFLLDFAIAALSAYGFEALLHPLRLRWRSAWRSVFPVLGVALAAVALVFVPLM
ncbi:MAG: YfhO family protein, partial [Chloroflexi bacterium]|nr:YfhO family protein [Chloroflexota bacterium]